MSAAIVAVSCCCCALAVVAIAVIYILYKRKLSKTTPAPESGTTPSAPVTGGGDSTGKFPAGALDGIKSASGLSDTQIDRIMQLIMNFEQSDTRWWMYYGYCRALSYDYSKAWRGTTVSLYGATTYNNNPQSDAARLFKHYGKSIKDLGWKSDKECCQIPGCKGEKLWTISTTGKTSDFEAKDIQQLSAPCTFCRTVANLNNDTAWRTAVWKGFASEYFLPAVAELKKVGIPLKAATVGFVVDWALNEGKSGMVSGLKKAGKSLTKAVEVRAKSGSCCNGSSANAKKRAQMWGEAISKNPDLATDVASLAAKFKPT